MQKDKEKRVVEEVLKFGGKKEIFFFRKVIYENIGRIHRVFLCFFTEKDEITTGYQQFFRYFKKRISFSRIINNKNFLGGSLFSEKEDVFRGFLLYRSIKENFILSL
ncbi:MAG: hypothetical protein IPL87_00525 [Candidatus Moraniibacteriota bacterium]|nr:MAG: hypothetical protein IPL87_00525 [Candidatus Moranbacteria bacterium]